MKRSLLGLLVIGVTIALIAVGTLWPSQIAQSMANMRPDLMGSSDSPQAAVEGLLRQIGRRDFGGAYSALANKSEFTQSQFEQDLNGSHGSLRTYATLDGFDVHSINASSEQAEFQANLRWSSVVGIFPDVRNFQVKRVADHWQVVWPLVKEPVLPPQVIPVNYLRWDVIYRGSQDDWGAQDVESPHVRIVAMHPVDRKSGGVIILGELLNEDVVPAYVTVKSTLVAKDGSSIGTEDAFDQVSHILLPKQVTPFRIDFRDARLSKVDSVRMEPTSSLISASADPVISIEGQKLNLTATPSLTGELTNQSGQIVNVAHVLATFYNNSGEIVWVSDQYVNRALLPQTPVPFAVTFPVDIAGNVANYRVIATAYSSDRLQ